jgi:hypothetical protein
MNMLWLCCYQFVQPNPIVMPRRMRKTQRHAFRAMESSDEDDGDPQPPQQEQLQGQHEGDVDDEQAMDEIMTNYFPDHVAPTEEPIRHPRHNHKGQKLWEEAQAHAHT